MKLTEYFFKVISSKGTNTRGLRIILLYLIHFSAIITTFNGTNINLYLGFYKLEIGIGFYITEKY